MIHKTTLKQSFAIISLHVVLPAAGAASFAADFGQADSAAPQQSSRPIGPGVVHHQRRDPAGPWVINIVEIDRRNPYLRFETAKAGHRLQGLAKTSDMAAATDAERRRVVAAINGDFFDKTGLPLNLQIRRGELWRGPSQHSAIAFTANGAPCLELFTAFYRLRTADSHWNDVHGYNRSRQAIEAILYTHRFGAATGTNAYGSEAVLQLLSPFAVNDTVKAVVREKRLNAGNAPLAPAIVVLSAHGVMQTWLNDRIQPGDTLLLTCGLQPEAGRIVEAVGGLPRLVRDGRVSVETEREGGKNFANVRHPRTAVGISTDSSKIFFVTVDGRQADSDGMTLYELADFMISLGCSQALNLDGGGSATMVVRGKVVNKPSDESGERPVANALLLISRAPTGALARITIEPDAVICPPGESVNFLATGTDSFFNPLALDDDRFIWRLSSKKASAKLDGKGKFVAEGSGARAHVLEDSVFVVVTRPGTPARDSVKVILSFWREVRVEPDSLSLVVGSARALQATVVDSRGRLYKKPPARLSWQVEGKVGTISATGIFSATTSGEGLIGVSFMGVEKKIPVTVKPK